MLTALAGLAALGTLLNGAEARLRPRAPVATPVERLVLGSADTPGLAAKRSSAAFGQVAVARALRPARLPKLAATETSRFGRKGAELWSLAFTLKSTALAQAGTASVVRALRRTGLKPKRATVGQRGWLVMTKRGGTALVVWQRRNAVGEILLTAKLAERLLGTVATQYASVADAHMEHLLSRDAWQRTLEGIRPDSTVPRKVALDLFALAYGPLPGTKRPPGPSGPAHEGTLAARAILRILPTLTPVQRAAALRALGLSSVQFGKARVSSAVQSPRGSGDYGDPTFKPDAVWTARAEKWAARYAQKLNGLALNLKIVAGPTAEDPPDDALDAVPVDANGTMSNAAPFCRIRVTPKGAAMAPNLQSLALAHEVFHCFEYQIMTPEIAMPAPDWLIEGMADWAALIVDPIGWGVYDWLGQYLDTPGTSLFGRSYDAAGFFGHAEETTGDLWPRIKRVLKAPGDEFSASEAGGLFSVFLDSWGSSTFNLPKIGSAWTSTDPAQPPGQVQPASTPITSSGAVYAAPYTFARYQIDAFLAPESLIHVQIQGYARLSILAGKTPSDRTDLRDAWFWNGEGRPKCPAGTTGTPPTATPIGAIAPLGLGAGRDQTLGFITFESLEKYCKEKQKPPKPPTGPPAGGDGGGGGGGSSFADPHLVTFDGYWYDYQGAGEYTLARSPSGDLEVQAREQPFPGTSIFSKALAINTAFAMRVNGDRVGVYMPDLSVRVNGKGFVPTLKPQRLPRGGRIRLTSKVEGQIEVVWPDGSLVRVFTGEGLSVLVQPAKARQGTLQGLFGNFDADGSNDFVTRSGTRLNADDVTSSFRLLYHVFADSWRVTQGQSLFDYARGQSTRTFQKLGFPNLQAILKDLKAEQRRYAERYCRSLHIKKPEVFRACLLDVGATGDAGFATAAAQAERTAGGFPVPHKAAKPKQRAKPGSSKAASTWTRAAATSTGAVSLALDGGKVVAAYLNGQGAAEAMTFIPSTTKDVSGVRRNPITSGWATLGDPVLVPRGGGGLQVLLSGVHGSLGDPLNGVSFAPRNPDGSFGAPSLAATSTYAEFVAGEAVPAPDGAPLWAADRGGTLWLWRGATAAVGADLSGLTGGPAGAASVGRDRKGRYWLAWNTVFASQPQRNGLYLQQFDPTTLKPIGSSQQAPSSSAVGYSGQLPLACQATCRLVYFQSTKSGLKIVSWAPGERKVTAVAAARGGHVFSQLAASYNASGRLWVAWWDNGGNAGFGYRAVLGDARGARGQSYAIGRPAGGTGSPVGVITSGNNLVVLTVAKGSAPYVNVLAPR